MSLEGMATEPRCCSDNNRGEERNEDPFPKQTQTRLPRAAKQPHHGGYDCEFVKPPPVEFPQTDCPVCLLVLREPHQVACCGNSYCESCVKRVQDGKNPCPTCHESSFTTFPDKRLKRSLYSLKVYCCQRREGCEWTGELWDLDRHLNLQPTPENLLVGCQFYEVGCTYCTQPFLRYYIENHQSNECPKRPSACQHCNRYTATYEDVTQNHLPKCPCLPLSCPNNCGLVLQRRMLEHHVSRDCLLTSVQCDFHVVGCQVQLLRRNLLSHIKENLAKHTSLLQAHMETHPEESMTMQLMVNCIQKLVVDHANIWSKLSKALQSIQESSDELLQAHYEVQQTRGELEQTHHKLEQTQDELQQTRLQLHEMQERVSQQEKTGIFENQMYSTQDNELRVSGQQEVPNTSQQKKSEHVKVETESRTLQKCVTDQKLQELTEKLIATEKKLQALLGTQRGIITRCRNEGRILQRKQVESESKLTAVKVNLACRITASEEMIQAHEATLSKHQTTLEKMTFTGTLPFDFTMSEFDKHKKASDEWFSPPFYTHTQGYRLCLKVFANGSAQAKGTHISVLGFLMRGDFDDELLWPFQGAITIHLLNQLDDSSHHTRIINFTGATQSAMIRRVTSSEMANCGWGKGPFISHTALELDTKRNCQYLRENQLKFRISNATNLDPIVCIHRRCLALENVAEAIEPQVCVTPVEFTLSNFEQHKKNNVEWYSPPFYTHPQGYRMSLRVDPSGIGDGMGTHVSVFTRIMRGPFDGRLKWPFRGDVTIRIRNQANESNHHEGIIPYTDQTPESSAKVTDGERSFVWGKHQFLSHASLGRNAIRNTQYLQGDSLRIQVSKVELKN